MGRGAHLGRGVRPPDGRLRGAGGPLKVLDLTEFFSPHGGGVGTYLAAKARWCTYRDDIDHVVVAPGPRTRQREWYGSRLYEIAGPPIPASPGYHALLRPDAVAEILECELPDVIELGSIYLAPWVLAIAARGMRIPRVGLFHQDLAGALVRTLARRWPATARGAIERLTGAYLRAAYRSCRTVVGASDASLAAMQSAGIPETQLVPFGVDLDTFRPEAADPAWKREVRAANRPVALYVGRLTHEKNLGIVMQALPDLHRRFGVKLVLIGDGGWREALARTASTRPEMLTVLPYETDRARLARAYASADLYLAPSPHETFGLAALEAAACGLPLVAANAGALAERLRGATWARPFDPASAASLIEAVTSMLAADRAAAGDGARQAAGAYGWDRTFTAMWRVYREAMHR